jgi:hypothetical protein
MVELGREPPRKFPQIIRIMSSSGHVILTKVSLRQVCCTGETEGVKDLAPAQQAFCENNLMEKL